MTIVPLIVLEYIFKFHFRITSLMKKCENLTVGIKFKIDGEDFKVISKMFESRSK